MEEEKKGRRGIGRGETETKGGTKSDEMSTLAVETLT